MAGVPILLSWDHSTLADVAQRTPPAIFLLTNTRALAPTEAEGVTRKAAELAKQTLPSSMVVLRGDSTLRGHVMEEYLGARAAIYPQSWPVLVLVPALPHAGRITLDGIHYLLHDGTRTPIHLSEYGDDARFGYGTSSLLSWAAERSQGFFPADAGRELHLDTLRSLGAAGIAMVLSQMADTGRPCVVVPDAAEADDLMLIADGLRAAQHRGVPMLVRCAPALVGALCGQPEVELVPFPRSPGGLLVVCGSHVPQSTRQLRAVTNEYPLAVSEADIAALLSERAELEVQRVIAEASDHLVSGGLAIIATPRHHQRWASGKRGERVVRQVSRIVAALGTLFDTVIVKGGATSAGIAKHGLRTKVAWVVGPVADGVSCWHINSGERVLPYLVVPGNVGDENLLSDLVSKVRTGDDVDHEFPTGRFNSQRLH